MSKNKFFLFLPLIVAACGTTPQPGIKIETQKVEVPVVVPCKALMPATPQFNFDKLTVDKDIFVKEQALLADRLLHLGYEAELVAALNSCIK